MATGEPTMANTGELPLLEVLKSKDWMAKVPPKFDINRSETRLGQEYDKKGIDVINNYHAFCCLCDVHIYSRSERNDTLSMVYKHYSRISHKVLMELHPNGELFRPESETHIQCLLCGETNIKTNVIPTGPDLQQLLSQHEKAPQHTLNALYLSNPEMAFLRTLAKNSPLYSKNANQNSCKICEQSDLVSLYAHQRSYEHLIRLRNLLSNKFKFEFSKIDDENSLNELIAKISQWCQKSGDVNENSLPPKISNPSEAKKPTTTKKNRKKTVSLNSPLVGESSIKNNTNELPENPSIDEPNGESRRHTVNISTANDNDDNLLEIGTLHDINLSKAKSDNLFVYNKSGKCLACSKSIVMKGNAISDYLGADHVLPESWHKHLKDFRHYLNYYESLKIGKKAIYRLKTLPVFAPYGSPTKSCLFCENKMCVQRHGQETLLREFWRIYRVNLLLAAGLFRRDDSDDSYIETVNEAVAEFVQNRSNGFPVYMGIRLRYPSKKLTTFTCKICGSTGNYSLLKKHINECDGLKDLTGVSSSVCDLTNSLIITRAEFQTVSTKSVKDDVITVSRFGFTATAINTINCEICNTDLTIQKTSQNKMAVFFREDNPYLPPFLYEHLITPEHCLIALLLKNEAMGVMKSVAALPAVHEFLSFHNKCQACKKGNVKHGDDQHTTSMVTFLAREYGLNMFETLGLFLREPKHVLEQLDSINIAFERFLKRIKKPTKNNNKRLPDILLFRMAFGLNLESAENPAIINIFCDNCLSFIPIKDVDNHIMQCIIPKGLLNFGSFTCKSCNAVVISEFDIQRHKQSEEQYREKLKVARENQEKKRSLWDIRNVIQAKIVQLTDLPKASVLQLKDEIYSKLEKFGKIEEVKIGTGNSATIRFWIQSCAEKAAAEKTVEILGVTVQVSLLTSGEKGQPILGALSSKTVELLSNPSNLRSYYEMLIETAKKIYEDQNEKNREDILLRDLHEIFLKLSWGRTVWKLRPFGSRFIGLALTNDADFDVLAATNGTFCGCEMQDPKEQKGLLYQLQRLFRTSTKFCVVEVIPSARVPIIRLNHKASRLHCDLSFLNGFGVVNSEFIMYFLNLDDRVGPIVLYLKNWVAENGFKNLLTSYATTILIINYLGHESVGVLPTLHAMRARVKDKFLIAGFDATFDDQFPWLSHNDSPTLKLLAGFFEFYATFNWAEFVVYPVRATKLRRSDFLSGNKKNLPAEMLAAPSLVKPADEYEMVVFDPFDLTYNRSAVVELFVKRRQLFDSVRLATVAIGEMAALLIMLTERLCCCFYQFYMEQVSF